MPRACRETREISSWALALFVARQRRIVVRATTGAQAATSGVGAAALVQIGRTLGHPGVALALIVARTGSRGADRIAIAAIRVLVERRAGERPHSCCLVFRPRDAARDVRRGRAVRG